MKTSVDFKWTTGAPQKIKDAPDKMIYSVARLTLDRTYPHIPLATYVNAGNLRGTSMARGVQGSDGKYYIGSYTSYAKYVWNMGVGTNWSTPGTYGRWYEKVWKTMGKNLMSISIKENKLK